ncbi:type II secretion system F family protein [Collinsella sp. zg1085]|uniref:type II secretion system F family protein n=1 Tax=Collinsella sp. zg1085 TaxID=2844380 RepID=UPI001C0C1AFB|nr:type II secretion system F family protein [Collinsella sp. zg1085]QWT17465.1 type II secretion system F family protein [Collinsella sp. zg1085]
MSILIGSMFGISVLVLLAPIQENETLPKQKSLICFTRIRAHLEQLPLMRNTLVQEMLSLYLRAELPLLETKYVHSIADALFVHLVLSLVSAAIGAVLSGSFLGACVGLTAPSIYAASKHMKYKRQQREQIEAAMPEAFRSLSTALGSGCSLAQAMRFVGSHAKEPLQSEFMRVGFSIECGVPATEALDNLLQRLRAPGLGLVAIALKVSQKTGAPLQDLLSQAANTVGTRIELKRLLEVKTAQARLSARMVAAMPVALMTLLSLLSPDFREGILLPAGMLCIIVALILNALAWIIISRIMRVGLE